MALHTHKGVFGINPEVSIGTFVEPAGDECFYVFDFDFQPTIEVYERQEMREHFGKLDLIPGVRYGTMAVSFLVVGSGTAGTAPHWGTAFQACGMSHTNTPATSDVYKPTNTFTGATIYPSASYSVAYWEDGVRYGLSGALGDWELTCTAGQPMVLRCTYYGALEDWADDTTPTVSGVSTAAPPNFLSASVETIGGYACVFEQLTYRAGNVMSLKRDANAASGVRGYEIAGRRMTGSFDPDMVLVATDGIYEDWKSGTTGAVSTGAIGSAGNQVTIAAARCQYRQLAMADKEGRRVLNADFDIVTSAAAVEGDDFSITLT